MRPWRLRHFARQIQHGTITVLFTVAYVISVIGVPVPAVVIAQEEPVASGHVCPCAPEGGCPQPCCCCVPSGQSESPEVAAPTSRANQASWGIAMKARECHGLDTEWVAGGAALPPPNLLTWTFEWNFFGNLAADSTCLVVRVMAPSEPPPRVG